MSNIVDDQITFLKNSIAEQSNQLQALEDNIKTEDKLLPLVFVLIFMILFYLTKFIKTKNE